MAKVQSISGSSLSNIAAGRTDESASADSRPNLQKQSDTSGDSSSGTIHVPTIVTTCYVDDDEEENYYCFDDSESGSGGRTAAAEDRDRRDYLEDGGGGGESSSAIGGGRTRLLQNGRNAISSAASASTVSGPRPKISSTLAFNAEVAEPRKKVG